MVHVIEDAKMFVSGDHIVIIMDVELESEAYAKEVFRAIQKSLKNSSVLLTLLPEGEYNSVVVSRDGD
jgi:hypothetical protein